MAYTYWKVRVYLIFLSMRIELWSIGKAHEAFVKSGIEEFTKRLNHYFKTEWIFLQKKANTGLKKMIFLIGGAYGVDATVQQRAQYTWSLSKLVFPHQLVRLILAEQLYRAGTILKNEKYHHQ